MLLTCRKTEHASRLSSTHEEKYYEREGEREGERGWEGDRR